MTAIERSALLPHPVEHLFDLVNDIERYPEYMQGCVGAEVLARESAGGAQEIVIARLELARGPLRQSFVTRNRVERPSSIHMGLEEGPFRRFRGEWSFVPLGPSASKVGLVLEFELANRLIGRAAGKLFESVASQLVDSLSARAATTAVAGR
ncbi:MAG: type II toxin-antitoxin system RatA family toxin [Pseudomonadota bacterium]|nr:type II toxin-antitoxin system RatA family toxin [Pseudomonadota bacterium]